MKRSLLLLFLLLIAWKVVRTDWIVISPWQTSDSNGLARTHEATYRPPVSPAWRPPRPIESGHEFPSWERAMNAWYGSGANGSHGVARIRPDWLLIGLKVGFPFVLVFSIYGIRYFATLRGTALKVVRQGIEESKKQNKAEMATPRNPSD